jgi:hypothetical protein
VILTLEKGGRFRREKRKKKEKKEANARRDSAQYLLAIALSNNWDRTKNKKEDKVMKLIAILVNGWINLDGSLSGTQRKEDGWQQELGH